MSIKIVEGQLKMLKMLKEMTAHTTNPVDQTIHMMVSATIANQALYPDVLTANAQVEPHIDAETGKLITEKG